MDMDMEMENFNIQQHTKMSVESVALNIILDNCILGACTIFKIEISLLPLS
jgi:hypothetical protein